MGLTNNPILFFAAIIIGMFAQVLLTWFKRHDKKSAYGIFRPMVLLYWLTLSVMAMLGGTTQLQDNDFLPAMGSIALGLGLLLSASGQILDRERLKSIGVVTLSIGPIVSGVRFLQYGDTLAGMIAFALGLGILVSTLKGWPGGIGQVVIGAVILGSSTMLIISLLVKKTAQTDFANVAIGVAMFALGLWVIANGIITALRLFKKSSQTAPQS